MPSLTGAGTAVLEESQTLSAVSADDEEPARDFVESKFNRASIDVTKRDSVEGDFIEVAKDAEIIALDLRFDNVTAKSTQVAQYMKWKNPYRAIFFFTRVPEEVRKESLVNFAVEKDSEAAQQLDRISLMILVHDISLAILKDIYNLPAGINWERKRDRLLSIFSELRRFYGLLFPTQRSAAMVDENLGRRYQGLRELRAPFVVDAGQWTTPGRVDCLPPVQRILFDGMCREFSDLETIRGVEVRRELADEVAPLKPPDETVGGAGGEAAAADESETFYLNVWFPDRPAEQPWLVVRRAERMLVNLGALMEEGPLGKSEPVSEEAEETLETVEYVDVLIQCSDADVVPLHSRIRVPPRKENTAQFEVTPRRGGEIPLTVVLLVKNDPIHRTHLYFEAKEAEPDGER
jgi:hypothetical protein